MEPRWNSLSGDDLEREYSPSSCLKDGDYRPFVTEYRSRSNAAHEQLDAVTIAYGPDPTHTIDLAVPQDPNPDKPAAAVVFIHGGYWQELSKLDSFFAAPGCLEQGIAYAAVDYTLAPDASLDQIVVECRQAVSTLRSRAGEWALDPDRIVVAGSSAGAHLSAMTALSEPIAGAVLVSGIFELEPLIGTSINEAIGLDAQAAQRNSPLLMDPSALANLPPTVFAFGEIETDEFKDQTRRMARAINQAKSPDQTSPVIEIPARNHFDVVLDLGTPTTQLGAATASLLQRT